MERRKGIPLVALVIFIVLLVTIIITCLVILGVNKKGSGNKGASTVSLPENQQPAGPTEELLEVFTKEDALNNSSEVQAAYRLVGNNKTYAKYALYQNNGFKSPDKASNDLKLQLAMSQVTSADMDSQSTKKAVSADVIDTYSKKLFGDTNGSLEHEDFKLYNSDYHFSDTYKTIGYTYDKNTANYEIVEGMGDEEAPPEVVEIITKAEIYNTKIVIYVSPLFIDCGYKPEYSAEVALIYKEYDFTNQVFPTADSDILLAVTYDDYKNAIKQSYSQDIDNLKYDVINENIDLNQLQEYKYTLTIKDGGYEFTSFEEIQSSTPESSGDDQPKEMTEQEKSAYNLAIEQYSGNSVGGNDLEKLLKEIISKNEANKNDLEKIISVSFNDQAYVLEDEVSNLNDDIEDLIDSINYSAIYKVKPVYNGGLIVAVDIQEN